MINLFDLFLSLDSFGAPIELNFKGKKRFATVCGSLISAFLNITFVMYSFQRGLDFLNRSDINVSTYDIIDLDEEGVVNFEEQSGGLMFRVKINPDRANGTGADPYDALYDLDDSHGKF